ncbi:hypothetical protein AALO_G00056860 [Alosa alosa]|uniref:Transmembrane protein n=1 Tax=Alosa alosa TaxID=278164 RepID=A0AAV6H8P7_9TELE|nr:hypothetical protein AALO_G00056860 [Alosa alosa]
MRERGDGKERGEALKDVMHRSKKRKPNKRDRQRRREEKKEGEKQRVSGRERENVCVCVSQSAGTFLLLLCVCARVCVCSRFHPCDHLLVLSLVPSVGVFVRVCWSAVRERSFTPLCADEGVGVVVRVSLLSSSLLSSPLLSPLLSSSPLSLLTASISLSLSLLRTHARTLKEGELPGLARLCVCECGE